MHLANYHFDKLFSPEEACELIPRLELLIRDLQSRAGELRGQIADVVVRDPGADHLELAEVIAHHPELRAPAARMAELAQEIESLGCFLKDIDLGLIDFPWEIDEGKVVFLCWQPGESEIVAWHTVESGFAERRPLPGASKPYLH
jgi:hypothetical protein